MLSSSPFDFLRFHGNHGMAEKIRHFDWAATPVGSPETWPTALKTVLAVALSSKFPKAIVWGPELTTFYNDGFAPILGEKPEALGRPFSEVWAEAWDEISPIVARAFAGQSTFIEDFPLTVNRHGYPERAYFTFCYSPVSDENGRVLGMLDTVMETTGKVEADRQARILNSELQHRIKNTLTVISSIAGHSIRNAPNLKAAESALMFRLNALAEGHQVLASDRSAEADMTTLIRAALIAHTDGDRVSLEGHTYSLPERQALTLSLVVNELVTNALKYGALSVPEGRVIIGWEIAAEAGSDAVRFWWREQGGPAVTAPNRKGFGSRLVERVAGADFNGTAVLRYEPAGLIYTLEGRVPRE